MGQYIISVDPALGVWAYSVFDKKTFELVEFKAIRMSSKISREERMWMMFCTLDNLFEKYDTDILLTEHQFAGSLLQTIAVPGMVAGKHKIEVRYLYPISWKKWGVENFKATKEEGQAFVRKVYPELAKAGFDVCDSVAFVLAYKNNPNIAKSKFK